MRFRCMVPSLALTVSSIKQRDSAGPARRAAFNLVRETGDDEAMIRKLLQIAQLLHMAIRNFAAGFVALPDDRWVMRLQPPLTDMNKRRVPAPGVDACDAHAALAGDASPLDHLDLKSTRLHSSNT